MVFSSHLFVFYFLPVSLLGYYLAPLRVKNGLLTLVSFVFYGWANPLFIPLLITSTLIDYFAGLGLTGGFRGSWREPLPLLEKGGPRSRTQKLVLAGSMVSNVLLLGFFKYFNFGVDSYDALIRALGLEAWRIDTALHVVLPLGISFYTFQSMSYAIDVYRGNARAMRNLVDFFCFESMFPQLVAGPIIRFQEVADQLLKRSHTAEKFARGVAFFSFGMAKKVLIANPCGKLADSAFDAASVATADAWTGLVAYAFQIYFDFSGYSDMAVGLGLMLGFVFAKNFDSPYLAESITDFWRRWHISLSSWLRDYLYVPLGGNRKRARRTYLNLAVVMLLGGLWHGASWNFVIWGAIHGGLLAFERWNGKASVYGFLPRPARVATTFFLVLLSWVFFRAATLPRAVAYLGCLVGAGSSIPGTLLLDGILYRPYYLLTLALAAVIVFRGTQTWDWTRSLTWPRAFASLALLWTAILVLATQAYNPFIYFIF